MTENEKSIRKLGLALSGGGYRAAAFHLGTLRTLDKMNILKRVDVLSTVSGGSIVGADYALSSATDTYLTFEKKFISKLKQSVIRGVLASFTFIKIVIASLLWIGAIIAFQFSHCTWASWIILIAGPYSLIKLQFKIFP